MKRKGLSCLSLVLLVTGAAIGVSPADKEARALGIFEQATDIGRELLRGSSDYNAAAKRYTVTGGGADIWGNSDDFHFLSRTVSGKWMKLACTLEVPPEEDDPYPKAGLMFRESFESSAPFVDAVLHANGMIALQFRRRAGGHTEQIVAPIRGNRLILERKNHWLVMWVGIPEGGYVEAGSIVFDFPDTFYAGLAVCAHNRDRRLTVRFSDVTLETAEGRQGP